MAGSDRRGEREIQRHPSRSCAAKRARFAALIGAHGPRLAAAARRFDREPAAAADLIQDTLERAWRHFDALQDDERARGWLVRIMRNAWLDQLRRRRPEVPIEDEHQPPIPASDEPSWWERITIEDLRAAIAELQEPYRSASALHDLEGHSYLEVARRLGIPSTTAATRIHRAHRRIRELLESRLELL
jgi:RNA polymerase sigma-70 factor (ECF subfamily)